MSSDSKEEFEKSSNGVSDQGYQFTKPITFHLGFYVPSNWNDEVLLDVFQKWQSVCKPHHRNFQALRGQVSDLQRRVIVRMVVTDPVKAFEILKDFRGSSSFPWHREAKMEFRGVWVFAQGTGGPAKMLPNVSRTSLYSWTASDSSKLQLLTSWYVDSYPGWRIPSKKDFPFFGDFLHDYDNFEQGCLLALPDFRKRNLNARTDPRISAQAFDHPVIVVENFKNGIANIVICTSFKSRSVEDRFRDEPEQCDKYVEMASQKEFSEDKDLLRFSDFKQHSEDGRAGEPYDIQNPVGRLDERKDDDSMTACGEMNQVLRNSKDIPPKSYLTSKGPTPLHLSLNPTSVSTASGSTLSENSTESVLSTRSSPDAFSTNSNIHARLFPLLIRNLARNTTNQFLQEKFAKWKSILCVWVFKSEFENRLGERGVVVFGSEEERHNAIEEFQVPYTCAAEVGNIMYWAVSWSDLYSKSVLENAPEWKLPIVRGGPTTKQKEEELKWHQRYWGRTAGDKTTGPGTVLMLPPFRYRRPEFYIDPRIEPQQYGHPVIVTQKLGDRLWSIVICTYNSKELEIAEDETVEHRYVKIAWASSERGNPDVLQLEKGKTMREPFTYAGTESYIVEINALARLWDNNSRPSDWKVANMDLLEYRIKKFGPSYEARDPRWHPAHKNPTYTPKLGIPEESVAATSASMLSETLTEIPRIITEVLATPKGHLVPNPTSSQKPTVENSAFWDWIRREVVGRFFAAS